MPGLTRACVLVALAVAVVSITSAAQADVIVADTFTSNPGPLSGRPLETPQTTGDVWNIVNSPGSNVQVAGGALAISNASGTGFAKAVAPFSPLGLVAKYTLSLDLTVLPGSTMGTFYTGFGNDVGGFADYTGGPMFWTDNGVSSSATSLVLDAGPAFGAAHQVTLNRLGDGSYAATLAIAVDPALSSNNVEFFVNGNSLGTATYSGALGGLWTKIDYADVGSGVTLDNLAVTTAVPEPAALGLLGVAALALLRRRA